MDTPETVRKSGLYQKLERDKELLDAVLDLRNIVERYARTIERVAPDFTDHSVAHMDALWGVAASILTAKELEALTTAEAFLLAAGFYLHDIGMAYAATEEGVQRLKDSPAYKACISGLEKTSYSASERELCALSVAIRKYHASAAEELALKSIPGVQDQYLFEKKAFREAWGNTAGRIASSHHWNLERVERELGGSQIAALPGGRRADLAYVATLLRIVDFAHINRDRAPILDLALRGQINDDSRLHWLAQGNIDGPIRTDNELTYTSAKAIENVDAWWLFYEFLTGLDTEIREVKRYLDRRNVSVGRFSLQGVRGALSPEDASTYIQPHEFLPIEINLRTGSIDRLVQLLAGESLYGPEPMAAVRELIQNAKDAIMLKSLMTTARPDKESVSRPIRISLNTQTTHSLEIRDWGVGMSRQVITDYLLSIASDYWNAKVYMDYPLLKTEQVAPIGKFGIGFLSVFMLGDEVTVETNRDGGERLQVQLHGAGRRGEIKRVSPQSGSGTAIGVQLKETVVSRLIRLDELVRIYAPAINHPIEVSIDGKETVISANWIEALGSEDYCKWLYGAFQTFSENRRGRGEFGAFEFEYFLHRQARLKDGFINPWLGDWPEYREGNTRLLSHEFGRSLLCLKGFALQTVGTPGFIGLIDLQTASPNTSRTAAFDADLGSVISAAIKAVNPMISNQLSKLAKSDFVGEKIDFIAKCVQDYGPDVLRTSTLPWINELKKPGDLKLRNCAEFIKEVSSRKSIFISYGTGPWTAMKQWSASNDTNISSDAEIAIVLDDAPGDRLPYISGEAKIGSLQFLWKDCSRTALFGLILRLVAESWQVSVDALIKQDGWRHEVDRIHGRLVRP